MSNIQMPLDYSYLINTPGFKFSDEQNEAIDVLSHKASCILRHQAGLGKTLTCLAVAKLYSMRPPKPGRLPCTTVFFFPKSAAAAFQKELNNKLKEDYAYYSCTSKIRQYTGQPYLLVETTYLNRVKSLIKEIAKERPLACFFDEAHTCSDKSTKLFNDFMEIRPLFSAFHPVTATPLINSFENFFNLLQMVDQNKWRSFEDFRAKYCETRVRETNVSKWISRKGIHQKISFVVPVVEIIDYKNLDELQEYMESISIAGAKRYNLRYFYRKTTQDSLIKEQYFEAAKGKFDRNQTIDNLIQVVEDKGLAGDFPIPEKEFSFEEEIQRVVENGKLKNIKKQALVEEDNLLFEQWKELDEEARNYEYEDKYFRQIIRSIERIEKKRIKLQERIEKIEQSIEKLREKYKNLRIDKAKYEKELEENPKEDTTHGARLHNLQRIVDGSYCVDKTNKIQLLLNTLKSINESGDGASLVYVEYDDSVELLKYWLTKEKECCGINNIHILSGKVKEKDRVKIEQTLDKHDVVIVTSAGKQSRNLQRANNFLFYDLPFSVGTIIQCIGRICRTDTKFKNQDIYIFEVEDTIDTYKRVLFQDNVNLISQLFSDQTTLPVEMMKVEQKTIDYLKRQLLWLGSAK